MIPASTGLLRRTRISPCNQSPVPRSSDSRCSPRGRRSLSPDSLAPAFVLRGGDLARRHEPVHTISADDSAYYGDVDSVQMEWLERDLGHVPATMPIVTFNHIPMI